MESEQVVDAAAVDRHFGGGGGGGGGGGADTRGKHRILAEMKRVEQEIKFLEEELEELERTDNVSAVCEELLHDLDSMPDPLLPVTHGPVNPLWDRWFEGPGFSKLQMLDTII